MKLSPTLFCYDPTCQIYIGAQAVNCPNCGWQRPTGERCLAPGEAVWEAHFPGPLTSLPVATGDLVLCVWGRRGGPGCIWAVDRLTGQTRWQIESAYSIECSPTVAQGCVYWASLGFLEHGARLACHDLQDGTAKWTQELSSGVWSSPVVDEARVYVGCADGALYCFDASSGQLVYRWQERLPKERVWVGSVGERLVLLSAGGEVLPFEPRRGRPALGRSWHLEGAVTGPPCFTQSHAYCGLEGGRLVEIDLHAGRRRTLWQSDSKIVAAPAVVNDRLYFGGRDHHLRALDLDSGKQIWQVLFEHGLAVPPWAGSGLVAAAANGGQVRLLDAESGRILGQYALDDSVILPSAPRLDGELLIVGGSDGRLVALPWHIGNYAAAAGWLNSGNQYERAAELYLSAANAEPQAPLRQSYYKKATECWDALGRPEWAARLREGLADEQAAAEAYCRAAEQQRGMDNHRAAEFYARAARLYWRLEAAQEQADACERAAAKIGRWPLLRLKGWNMPQMTQGQPGQVTLRMENIGYRPAENINLNLSGSLLEVVNCVVLAKLARDSYFDIVLNVVPTQAENLLRVQAEYCPADWADRPLNIIVILDLRAAPPRSKITIRDSMIRSGTIKVVTPDNQPVDIEIEGLISKEASLELIQGGEADNHHPQPDFAWPELPKYLHCDERNLIAVQYVEEVCTVPSGFWAIFLADQAAITTVAPGRYTRGSYPHLQPRRFSSSLPEWVIVRFLSGPFRLAYRLGPYRTREGVQVGVECGLTVELDHLHPYEKWRGILGQGKSLNTQELAEWLEGEIAGTLQNWLAGRSEAELTAGFAQRENLSLNLLEELRATIELYGVLLLDPLWALNFHMPGREPCDALRESEYWKNKLAESGVQGKSCPACGKSVPEEARFCIYCREDLENP